jgi:hypothetical protein
MCRKCDAFAAAARCVARACIHDLPAHGVREGATWGSTVKARSMAKYPVRPYAGVKHDATWTRCLASTLSRQSAATTPDALFCFANPFSKFRNSENYQLSEKSPKIKVVEEL